MSERLIDAIHSTRDALKNAEYEIREIAFHLDIVGLTKVADRLYEVAQPFNEISQNLSNAFSDKLNADLAHSKEMTGNLLLLALNGAIGNHKEVMKFEEDEVEEATNERQPS